MQINSKDLNLFQLLSIQSEQFVVPSYQRRYAWQKKQIAALFEDIDMLREDEGHLFGMLILHSSTNQGMNKAELVDGQQRITTISLLLIALRNRYLMLENQSKYDEVNRMLFYKGYDDIAKSKLILGELDNKDYQCILKGDIKGIVNKNLEEAFNWFSDEISKHDKDWLNRYYYKFVNVAKIIRLDVGMAKDAYKLFETINNRGLRLSPTDLLKNFILGHAAKISEITLEEAKSLWSVIILSLDGIDTDMFFRQFMCGLLTRQIPKSKLVEEFKKYYLNNVKHTELLGEFGYYSDWDKTDIEDTLDDDFEDDETTVTKPEKDNRISIEDFLKKISFAAACYQRIVRHQFSNVKINRRLKNLSAILSTPTYIFLMFYLQKNDEEAEKLEIMRMFEVFMLRRHICNKRTSQNDNIFANLLRLEGPDLLQKIKKQLAAELPGDIEFEGCFPIYDFEGILIPRAKYVLSEIEYFERGNTGEFSLNSGDEVHLEHIIPEKIKPSNWKRKYGDWEEYLGEHAAIKHKNNVSKIGNMSLLAGDLNISASNNPFISKQECYKQSDIKITQILGNDYHEFKFDNVVERGNTFTKIALAIWKL